MSKWNNSDHNFMVSSVTLTPLFQCLNFCIGEGGEMDALQGPVICHAIRSKHGCVYTLPANGPFSRAMILRSGFWGCKGGCRSQVEVGVLSSQRQARVHRTILCSISSSSNDNGSMAENFSENDEDCEL